MNRLVGLRLATRCVCILYSLLICVDTSCRVLLAHYEGAFHMFAFFLIKESFASSSIDQLSTF